MYTRILQVLLLTMPSMAYAIPAEDHWTVEVDPVHRAALMESEQLIEDEKFAQALPILQQLAEDLPSNPDVFNLLGFAHRKTGNLALSGEFYERALYLKPDHIGALEYQGELFLMQGNLEGAEANLRRLEEICETPCEEQEELDEAIRAYQAQ